MFRPPYLLPAIAGVHTRVLFGRSITFMKGANDVSKHISKHRSITFMKEADALRTSLEALRPIRLANGRSGTTPGYGSDAPRLKTPSPQQLSPSWEANRSTP